MRRAFGLTGFLIVAACAAAAGKPAPILKMKGVCWEGSGRIDSDALAPVAALGADWISQTPFGWVPSLTSTEIRMATTHAMWGESDDGLVQTATWARARGMKTLLKPHLWVRHADWQGNIVMPSDGDWARWFASYEAFILHYAELAQKGGIEALAVGTELGGTTGREKEWRSLIAKIRAAYSGKLTYCANWNGEPEKVPFWDALDFIGVQAYYPLSAKASPSTAEIVAAWAPIAASLEALSKRTGKPVVFTEVGFKSVDYGLKEPWVWDTDGPVNLDVQKAAYEALFSALWDKPWFGGTFVWKWHPMPRGEMGANPDFTPQGKPALEVIRKRYGRGAPKP